MIIIFSVKQSVDVRIHIGHYKEKYLCLCIPIILKIELKRDLSFNYIKDFSDLLIIHVSKENLCVLKGRYTLGSYKPYCMALYIQSINISVTIKLRNTKTSYHFFFKWTTIK